MAVQEDNCLHCGAAWDQGDGAERAKHVAHRAVAA
jgi:hypothetical protein